MQGATRRRPALREAELRALHRSGEHRGVSPASLGRCEPAASSRACWKEASLPQRGRSHHSFAEVTQPTSRRCSPTTRSRSGRPPSGRSPCSATRIPLHHPPDVGAVATLPLASVVAEALLWSGRPGDAARADGACKDTRSGSHAYLVSAAAHPGRHRGVAGPVDDRRPPHRSRPSASPCSRVSLPWLPGTPNRPSAVSRRRESQPSVRATVLQHASTWRSSKAMRCGSTANHDARSPAGGGALVGAVTGASRCRRMDRRVARGRDGRGGLSGRRTGNARPIAGRTWRERIGSSVDHFGSLVLAEARWRQGDETGHDEAVDDATAASAAVRRTADAPGRQHAHAGAARETRSRLDARRPATPPARRSDRDGRRPTERRPTGRARSGRWGRRALRCFRAGSHAMGAAVSSSCWRIS